MKQKTRGALVSIKTGHKQAILDAIAAAGPATQAELSRRLGVSRSTITNLIAELKDAGKVKTVPVISSGRRAIQVQLVGSSGYYLGVDMDSRKVAFVICDVTGEILTKVFVRGDRCDNAKELVKNFKMRLVSELKKLEIKWGDIKQACVAVSSPVNPSNGEIMSDEFFRNWDSKSIIEQGIQVLDCPVCVDNDATLAALGEKYYGVEETGSCFVMVYVDHGIGAGLVINDEPYAGFLGIAGEIGHNRLDGVSRMCRCGNTGCVETISSVRAVVESSQQIIPNIGTIEDVLQDMESGDVAMERLVSDAGAALGKSLVPLINTLNPQRVYLGGSALAVNHRFVRAFAEEASRSVFAIGYPRTEFATATDWQFTAAKGAVARARLVGLKK